MSVRLAEPPSVVGTCGAQIDVEERLEVDAVETGACVDESDDSPDSSRGTWDVFDDDTLMPPVLPPAAPPPAVPVDPVAVAVPPAPPDDPDDPLANDPEDEDAVVTLRGSVPVSSVVLAWLLVLV